MPSPSLRHSLQRLWSTDTLAYSLRVFIALAGAMLVGLLEGRLDLVIPLFLGVIASALAETDDNWLGRLQAVAVTLLCFAVAAFSVQLLFLHPWLFVSGLAVATFALTMLGAVGPRYATLGWATLILAIYTMIGVEQRGGVPGSFWHEPLLLLAGAAWYGALSVLWAALFVHQPVQQGLARLFEELGLYLKIKSSLLEPLRQLDVEERRLELARQNGRVVNALNQAKEILLHRFANGRPSARLSRYLRLYFTAQDIHERASSSHYPYNELAEAFFHSDVMFRCQRLLNQQGNACRTLGRAIRLREPFDHGESRAALDDLQASLAHLREQNRPEWRKLLRSVNALANNLETLERKLAGASNPDALADEQDPSLFDRSPRSLREALQRIRLQLTPTSLVFRHALRLSIALCAGYGILHWIDPTQGYWILLTTLFVCQPNYGATRTRLVQRILGTLIGLVCGWALISLFPQALLQAFLAVIAGVLFFATRASRYTVATAAITLLVLLSFNQIGDGYGLIWPRLFDTLLGSLIAIVAVFLILPDWQGRRLDRLLASTLTSHAEYLREILAQYVSGKRDDLAYRVARRNAHNADAALSTTLSNMLMEPGHFRRDTEQGFRFLVVTHTLLGYLSALGAHRAPLGTDQDATLLEEAGARIVAALEEIAGGLTGNSVLAVHNEEEQALAEQLEQLPDSLDDNHRLVQTQLALICRQLARLRTLGSHLLKREQAASVRQGG
ncbi:MULTISPECIES: YccS family putative transporter [Pseudomonas]|uniref:TIGR01666 family membrane protein n=1 Tax=Pseudomonas flexibilis TaxID=706570 RepID=A0A0B2D7V0_9PSED|nr:MULTISPECIES: YccS family putative transporter [Pseudomonas]KHL69042.1 hypothetical protein SF06_20860 [Pseudomonas flexibilis]KHO64843.1 YccS/YhfK family integral membrane protein [Pseudomonas flexibilis]SCX96520.1 TIGR01666 family membrane protein [Pseudomonas flexibilis]SIR00353.1 TIGR01666 family membrane protein [Pseudomonas flexibilis]